MGTLGCATGSDSVGSWPLVVEMNDCSRGAAHNRHLNRGTDSTSRNTDDRFLNDRQFHHRLLTAVGKNARDRSNYVTPRFDRAAIRRIAHECEAGKPSSSRAKNGRKTKK